MGFLYLTLDAYMYTYNYYTYMYIQYISEVLMLVCVCQLNLCLLHVLQSTQVLRVGKYLCALRHIVQKQGCKLALAH